MSNIHQVRRTPIAEYNKGVLVGIGCDHCANTAEVVLQQGGDSMAICLECSPDPS